MFFDCSHRRHRRRHHPFTDWDWDASDLKELKDSGLVKALAVGALIYLGAKTISRITDD
ncbi:MAG: hypothetical protein LBR56_07855 [Sporomusaceae bacterium]|jgi:hypothetical protein|nr:hypothetical protein [Sporomusaceae bacterium]